MPTGIYKRTVKIRKALSRSHMGKTAPNKGKKFPHLRGRHGNHWMGGVWISRGYKYIFSPNHPFTNKNKYVREHRLIIEAFLGRYLTSEEVIHHIDRDKSNNKIGNLQICSKGEHRKLHIK